MYPSDAIGIYNDVVLSTTTDTIIDHSALGQDFTVLSINLTSEATQASNSASLECAGRTLSKTTTRMGSNIPAIRTNEAIGRYVCSDDLELVVAGSFHPVNYQITYVPYDINATATPVEVTYQDFMFVMGVIVFLLSFIPLGILFSTLRKRNTQY